jgi:dual-specificity kinase
VLECWDRDAREYVAIKVIRSIQKYRDAAMIEIDVLHTLAKNDRTGSWLVLYLERCYYCHLIELCCNEWPALLVHIYFFFRSFIKICRKLDSSLHWMSFEDP